MISIDRFIYINYEVIERKELTMYFVAIRIKTNMFLSTFCLMNIIKAQGIRSGLGKIVKTIQVVRHVTVNSRGGRGGCQR